MDEEILAALHRGDTEAALHLLLRAYGPAVHAFCRRFLRDEAAAEDAMQNTMMSVLEHPDQLLEVTYLRGWLFRVAKNKCIDRARELGRIQKRRDRPGTPDIEATPSAIPRSTRDSDDGSAFTPDMDTRLFTAQERSALEECLATLNPITAQAVLLRFRDSLPWEEIARILDLRLDTIRMRARRGLKILRACLTSKGIER